jgi:hypothetical protein
VILHFWRAPYFVGRRCATHRSNLSSAGILHKNITAQQSISDFLKSLVNDSWFGEP